MTKQRILKQLAKQQTTPLDGHICSFKLSYRTHNVWVLATGARWCIGTDH